MTAPETKTRGLFLGALTAFALYNGVALAGSAPTPILAPGSYVSGGIGEEGQMDLAVTRDLYNLRLTFAEAGRGSYIADVTIMIDPVGEGTSYGPFADCGPLFHLVVTPGAYRISATHSGLTQTRTLRIGKRATLATLYWPVEPD